MIMNSLNSALSEVKVSSKDSGSSIETRLMKISVSGNKVNFIRLSSGEIFSYDLTEKEKTFYVCNAWVTDDYNDIMEHDRNSKLFLLSTALITILLIFVLYYFGSK